MEIFDIYIAYISWGVGGKKRPVLVYTIDEEITVYPVTTKYARKGKNTRKNFFKIINYKKSGLNKQSYIDAGTPYEISIDTLENKSPIGKLTDSDKLRFIEFIELLDNGLTAEEEQEEQK